MVWLQFQGSRLMVTGDWFVEPLQEDSIPSIPSSSIKKPLHLPIEISDEGQGRSR